MTDVLMDRLRIHLYITAAIAVFELAVSIAIAVLAYIANLLNPLVMLCVAALSVQSTAILILMSKYSRSMPYIRFMWFLEFLTVAVVIAIVSSAIPGISPDMRLASLLAALVLTMLAVGEASIEAPNWIYLLRKSKTK